MQVFKIQLGNVIGAIAVGGRVCPMLMSRDSTCTKKIQMKPGVGFEITGIVVASLWNATYVK